MPGVTASGMAPIRLSPATHDDVSVKIKDVELTRIGLGTNRLTGSPAGVALINAAVAAGVKMIDTAHLYTKGQSEATIGEALSPFPNALVVATKGGYEAGARPEVLRSEIEDSLRRLRTSTIDLYYLHRVDPQTPLEESLAAIKDHLDRGVIRAVGISNVDVAQVERARKVVEISAVQNEYSLRERKHDPVVDYCAEEGIVFVPFYPLRGTGGAALEEIARRHRATPAQVALAWLLRRSPVMLPIPGTLSLEHLRENLAALDLELTDAEYAELR
jgi:pyridoxine 4-dehydrogenase